MRSVHLVDHGVDAEGDDADDHADDEGDCGFREGEPRVPVETPARRRAALEALAQLVRRDLVRDGLVVESLEAGGGAGGDARLRPSPRVVVQHTVGVVHRRRRVVARATRVATRGTPRSQSVVQRRRVHVPSRRDAVVTTAQEGRARSRVAIARVRTSGALSANDSRERPVRGASGKGAWAGELALCVCLVSGRRSVPAVSADVERDSKGIERRDSRNEGSKRPMNSAQVGHGNAPAR